MSAAAEAARDMVERGRAAQAEVDRILAEQPQQPTFTITANQLCGLHIGHHIEIRGFVHPGPEKRTQDVTGELRELLAFDERVAVWVRGVPLAYYLSHDATVVIS